MTGVPRAVQAAAIPRIDSANCHITSGRSGLPKFRQFVTASGVAPVHATLRADSATACAAPRYGSSAPNRPLPSVDSASAFSVPSIRTSAASPPGPETVPPCTIES